MVGKCRESAESAHTCFEGSFQKASKIAHALGDALHLQRKSPKCQCPSQSRYFDEGRSGSCSSRLPRVLCALPLSTASYQSTWPSSPQAYCWGDIDLWTGPQLHRTLALAHVYCRTVASAICTSGRSLVIAHPDAMRGMALLTRRASVRFQNAFDKLGHRPGLRPRS